MTRASPRRATPPWRHLAAALLALLLAWPAAGAPARKGAGRKKRPAAAVAAPAPKRAAETESLPVAPTLPRRTRHSATALSPALAAPSALSPLPKGEGHGAVLEVAGGRAYLDAGSKAGLLPGRELPLARGGLIAGSCVVEEVAERSATCRGGDPRPGDGFVLGPAPEPEAARPLPPLVPPEEAARRREAVVSAPLALVEATVTPAAAMPRPYRAEARLIHQSFFASGAAADHEQRLEARVYGYEVAPSWQLWVDATARYRGATADGARFQPGSSATLEVRELQLATRAAGRPYALALGRVRPWFAPGSTVFDGAQAGYRIEGGEVGVFGGLVPDVATTEPTTERSTGGLYAFIDRDDDENLLHGEARLAAVRSPELGTRLEAELLGHVWIARRFDLSGQARLGMGGDHTAPAALDAARLDLSARLTEPLTVTAGLRYVGLFVLDPGAPALFPNPARHADLLASYDVSPEVTLRAVAGFAKDLTSGLERRYGGPEVALPRLFGPRGGVSAGWLEEGGWTGGRTVWAQAQGTALERLRLALRTSLFVDGREAPLQDLYTIGLAASAALDLGRFFSAGISALARAQLRPSEGDSQHGLALLASFSGRY